MPPPAEMSEAELAAVTPLLVGSGAAPLGWWKIRHSPLRSSPHAVELQEVYRFHALQAALHERNIGRVFALLDAEGVEALLIKGWAAARAYPEAGLRPYGDLDVCVRVGRRAEAARVLRRPEVADVWVDLHEAFGDSGRLGFNEQFERAEVVRVGGARVRVLAPEDHLRLLCVHMLRHGAWRPLWLCDVAAAVETRPVGFDWGRLLGGDRRRARWVACSVGLAHRLLGARVEDTPLARESERLPRWLVPEVLKQWETPFPSMQAPMRHRAPLASYLRRPDGLLRDLVNRWPNPIEATVRVGGPFNALPRLPFQLGYACSRAARFVARLPGTLRAQH